MMTNTKIGTVQDVNGTRVSVHLSDDTVTGFTIIDGEGYRVGQMGSFVRIPIGFRNLFGIVVQVGASAVPEKLITQYEYGSRWMTIELIGEGYRDKPMDRGISQYPTIGDDVHLLLIEEMHRVYACRSDQGHVRIGHVASSEGIDATLDVDRLVTRHCAVVGATGSGKSTTVATLLRAFSDQGTFPAARILVLDVHGEYRTVFNERSNVLSIDDESKEQRLDIPYWALNSEELIALTTGPIAGAGRGAVLDKIVNLKRMALKQTVREGVRTDTLTADTPVPFCIHKLWFDLYRDEIATYTAKSQNDDEEALLLDEDGEPVEKGDPLKVIPPRYKPAGAGSSPPFKSNKLQNIRKPLEAMASRLRDPRYGFLFGDNPWRPDLQGATDQDLDTWLQLLIGGDSGVTVLDLSGCPSDVLSTVVGAVLRILFDALFWSKDLPEGGRKRPLLVVLEEAHLYLQSTDRGPAPSAVRRIVKEGRKYGVGALIVSQRPAEIDATVLSQCGTIITLRLNNDNDRGHIRGSISDNLAGLLDLLSGLRTGEAIVIGEAVPIPMRVVVEPPPLSSRTASRDPSVAEAWTSTCIASDYDGVVARWRGRRTSD